MGRIIAIDYGTRRTGIAVSDPLQLIAGGLATVETRELERYLTQYIAREDVSVIVVGKPLKMNGAPSETMRFVLPLVARLHRTYPSIEVVLYDERFTSAATTTPAEPPPPPISLSRAQSRTLFGLCRGGKTTKEIQPFR